MRPFFSSPNSVEGLETEYTYDPYSIEAAVLIHAYPGLINYRQQQQQIVFSGCLLSNDAVAFYALSNKIGKSDFSLKFHHQMAITYNPFDLALFPSPIASSPLTIMNRVRKFSKISFVLIAKPDGQSIQQNKLDFSSLYYLCRKRDLFMYSCGKNDEYP